VNNKKNVIELFKLVADIQNPTIPMDERFKKIHASVDKIHDSYKSPKQLVMPATPSTPATTGGKRRKTRRNKRNTRKQALQ